MKISVLIFLFLCLNSVSAFSDSEAIFTLPSNVSVKITEAVFEKKYFKIMGCTETSVNCLINNSVPMGVAFGLPTTFVKSISITYKKQSYLLDVSNMYNAWHGRPLELKGVMRYFGGNCFDEKNCQFRGIFSDAGGTFVAEWRIVNGSPVRTVLSDSEDIVNLFMQNIDPPVFD